MAYFKALDGDGNPIYIEIASGAGTTVSPYITKTVVDSSALPTGAATSANQSTTNTTLSAIDGHVDGLEALAAAEAVLIGAVNETAPATDTASSGLNGRLQRIAQRITSAIAGVAATIADGANVAEGAVADAAVTAGATGTISAKLRSISRDIVANIVLAAGGNIIGKVGIDQTTPGTTNGVQVNAALPAGTNAIGKLASNTGVTIGAVEIAATQTLATVTTCSTLTGGGVAHDGADSGNPVKVGARCLASPAGATLVADADRTDLVSDKDGAAIFRNQTTLGDIKSTAQSVTANTSTAATNFGAVASTKNCITHITVWNSSATAGYVALQDGSGGTAFAYVPCPAGGGATLNFDPPLKQPTANTALYFSASPNASTVYVTINGFQSKI